MLTVNELKAEYWKAIDDLDVAYNHFNNAEPGFVDAAIAELSAAALKVSAIRNILNTRYGL